MSKQNGRILLINPCGWQKESVNIGLSYLAASLTPAGFQVKILDLNRYELDDRAMLERARTYDPFLIGISVKTATANEGGRLAGLLAKVLAGAALVAGGPHLTLCAREYLAEFPSFGYGIMGEGEESLRGLAQALAQGGSGEGLPGVARRRGEEIVLSDWAPPQDLDSLPFPDLEIIEDFTWPGFRYPILTSRGCPFSCTYCCVNKLTGSKKWRYRSPANVVEEIERVAREKGVTLFEIWDDNFTLDLDRAKEICRRLIQKNLSISWWCHNGIRADRIDPELARLMKKAGCTSVAFGMETANPEVFASIKKGESLSDLTDAVRIVKKAGIQAVGYFIIGLPGDDLESLIRTIRFQRGLKLDHYTYGMLIPYPQTELWEVVQTRGRMLEKITETQHFSDDLVPVSFELPSFPKKDMVRAFYLAKYMDLFEAVDRIEKAGSAAHVIFLGADHYPDHLAGMMIACPPGAMFTMVTGLSPEELAGQRGFGQVPPETRYTVDQARFRDWPQESTVYIGVGAVLTRRFLLSNANIVMFDVRRPTRYTVQVRRFVKSRFLLGFSRPLAGTVLAAGDLWSYYGPGKIYRVFRNQFHFRARTGAPPAGRIGGLAKRFHPGGLVSRFLLFLTRSSGRTRAFLMAASRKAATLASVGRFVLAKGRLKTMRHPREKFPYDEYSSYM